MSKLLKLGFITYGQLGKGLLVILILVAVCIVCGIFC